MLTIGSLFSGYGGLDLGVIMALAARGAESRTAWVSDIEPGPCKILAERFPGAPNLGDITAVDWTQVEPVDVICGGSPCQDLSAAGQRAGMRPGTRSGLWESMMHAIDQLRPRLVVWENVLGALSGGAFSLMEPQEGHLGNGPGGPVLRAPGRVLGDLASIGYDARWQVVRASDIGAPHKRARLFIVAYPHDDGLGGLSGRAGGRTQEIAAPISDTPLLPSPCAQQSGNSPELHLSKKPGRERVTDLAIIVENGLLATGGRLLPTPTAGDKGGRAGAGFNPPLGEVVRLFSTPVARDHKGLPQQGFNAASLPRDVALLPTPKAGDADFGLPRTSNRPPEKSTHLATRIAYTDWGDYEPAIKRWEQATGRPAPAPTHPSKTGKPQLAPAFVEWMMGLPQGWVTDIPISRAQQLRALGNGVIPAQAATAITRLLEAEES